MAIYSSLPLFFFGARSLAIKRKYLGSGFSFCRWRELCIFPLCFVHYSPNVHKLCFQVVRCCLEHASSVAKTFLMSDCVVVEIKEPEPVPAGNPMDNSGLFWTYLLWVHSSRSFTAIRCVIYLVTEICAVWNRIWVLRSLSSKGRGAKWTRVSRRSNGWFVGRMSDIFYKL